EQITWQKCSKGCYACPTKTCHQIADKANGNNHRAGGNHGNRDRIQKLPFGQPSKIAYNTAVEKRYDGETTAKYKCPRFSEKDGDVYQSIRISVGGSRGNLYENRERHNRSEWGFPAK